MRIWLTEIWHSWRASLRRPGFLLLAAGVLALGVAASSGVFTLIDEVLLKPLPIPQASRLVMLGRVSADGRVGSATARQYQALEGMSGVKAMGLSQMIPTMTNIAGGGKPAVVSTLYVDHHLLPTLGMQPQLGRNFTANEDRPHGSRAVLLSHGFWERRYGGNPQVIGRRLQVQGVAHTIVGVLPASFATLGSTPDIVLPTALPANDHDDGANYFIVARLANGVSAASVGARVDARLHAMYRGLAGYEYWQNTRFGAQAYRDWRDAEARPVLMLFLASGVFVLLIALVNLGNLMLMRSLAHGHELAVRSALGASGLRLLMPALAESLLVGLIGTIAGIAVAVLGLHLLQRVIPATWVPGGLHVHSLAGFILGALLGVLGAVSSAVLGWSRHRRAVMSDELREGGRHGMGVRSGYLSRVLVVVQVALATVLLCASGMFLHALYGAAHTPLGFSSRGILTFELSPVQAAHPETADMMRFSQRLLQRLRTQPGVTEAVAMTNLPVGTGATSQLQIGSLHRPGGRAFAAQFHGVGAAYFRLFGIHVLRGRGFASSDRAGSEKVAVVSRTLAAQRYAGHALGKLIQTGSGDDAWSARIVGVVADTHQFGPLKDRPPEVYVPFVQTPDWLIKFIRKLEPLRFALKVEGNPEDYRAMVHKVVASMAPEQPISNLRSMGSIVRATTADMRLNLLLVGVFAGLSLLLAAAGLYAVMAVAVAAREREFGVRVALGASPMRLLRLVLRGGGVQIATGLGIGVALMLALSGWLAHAAMSVSMSLLGRLASFDPAAIIGVCVVLAVAGLLACLLPALRAARVEPMHALRGE